LENEVTKHFRKQQNNLIMELKKLYCGIDVSGETLNICIQKRDGTFYAHKVNNNTVGFKELWQLTGSAYHFVMESTGVYHMPLIFFLHQKKLLFSVVNALQIKRYIQMHLERNKSDKIDAGYICQYGIDRNPACYEMPDQLYFECKSLNSAIHTITKNITSYKNKLHALGKLKIEKKSIVNSYSSMLKLLQLELKKLEKDLAEKLQKWQPKIVKQVNSVIGIGKKATSILVVRTQGFKHTENYQQLISYAGLSPKEYSSGSSIKGKVRICKQGGTQLRHTLYMCALNAKKNNPQCKALYDRLVAKGKNKKLALIAVCNKLLKQVFGVVKSGILYDKKFLEKIA
jgi:transposase